MFTKMFLFSFIVFGCISISYAYIDLYKSYKQWKIKKKQDVYHHLVVTPTMVDRLKEMGKG